VVLVCCNTVEKGKEKLSCSYTDEKNSAGGQERVKKPE